jgi:hypothetical protein
MYSAANLRSNKKFEKWKQQGSCFVEAHNRHQWQIGDWFVLLKSTHRFFKYGSEHPPLQVIRTPPAGH